MNNLEYVSKILHDEVGYGNNRSITLENISLLRSIKDIKAFLVFNYNTYDWRSNHALMLTFPQIWIDFTGDDWKEIISMNPNRKPILEFNEFSYSGIYSDLTFLYRILNIDTLMLLDSFDLLTPETKLNYNNYFSRFSSVFSYDIEELEEDLDIFYDTSLHEINNHTRRLIQGGFPMLKR